MRPCCIEAAAGVRFVATDGLRMKLQVNRQSEQPVHHQLREQIIFRISTGEVPIGHIMPSVRGLARELKIHHNTVNLVYTELANERWLVKQPGSRYVVVQQKGRQTDPGSAENPDDLINRMILLADQQGFSLQQLAGRIRERMFEQPPDHLLVVEPELGMGQLMREEIRERIGQTPAGCSVSMLLQNPSLAIGAVLLVPAYLKDALESIPSKGLHTVLLTYARPDPHVDRVRDLPEPSAIGMVSVSAAVLRTVSGLLDPVAGERHTLHEFLMEWPVGKRGPRFAHYTPKKRSPGPGVRQWEGAAQSSEQKTAAGPGDGTQIDETEKAGLLSPADLGFIDLMLCDSIAYGAIKHRRGVECQLLSNESLREIAAAAKSLV